MTTPILRQRDLPCAQCLLAGALVTSPMPSRAIEEPDYEVARQLGDVEIRPAMLLDAVHSRSYWHGGGPALQAAGIGWTGEPVYSRYNAPFIPWLMRRNEIWLALC